MKAIQVHVTIGKSKELITYTFLSTDFIRVEGNILVLKDEDRVIKIDEENVKQLIYQINYM